MNSGRITNHKDIIADSDLLKFYRKDYKSNSNSNVKSRFMRDEYYINFVVAELSNLYDCEDNNRYRGGYVGRGGVQ